MQLNNKFTFIKFYILSNMKNYIYILKNNFKIYIFTSYIIFFNIFIFFILIFASLIFCIKIFIDISIKSKYRYIRDYRYFYYWFYKYICE